MRLPDGRELGVHFLQYTAAPSGRRIYVNHGFGASSLSWLPAIPALAQRLNAAHVIGHDAAGFGFTERPDWEDAYSIETSAQLALALSKKCGEGDLILFGHSMGALTTLALADELPVDLPLEVILVSPALGIVRSDRNGSKRKKYSIGSRIIRKVLYPPMRYGLRRLVG